MKLLENQVQAAPLAGGSDGTIPEDLLQGGKVVIAEAGVYVPSSPMRSRSSAMERITVALMLATVMSAVRRAIGRTGGQVEWEII